MGEEPEKERENEAQNEAGENREIKSGVFAAVHDVSGEAAKPQRELSAEVQKSAYDNKEAAKNEKGAAEFAKRIHKKIIGERTD